jgi:hypothetical protein
MPKYVIHIGPSKTGSKFLQSMLFLSRETLLANGINYPENWWTQSYHITHDPLFRLLRNKKYAQVQEPLRQLNSSGCRIVVLSCEGFADLSPQEFEVLRDGIDGNPIEIVYYCRRWSDRIPSDWKQSVQMGMFATLPEFYVDFIRHAFYSGSVNYSLIWSNIASVFGRKSLKLVSYSNLRDQKIDLFRHFTSNFLQWDGEATIRKELVMDQASASIFDTEILRALNRIDYQNVGRHRWNMRIKFNIMRSEIDTRILDELMADDLGTIELSDGAEAFRLSWREMNKYADCLVPKSFFRNRVFELRAASIQYVRGNYLLKARATSELRSLYKHLDETPCDAPGLT